MRTLLALPLLALLVTGCDTDGVDAPSSDFGDPYGLEASLPAPALVGAQLTVPVTYGGGCADHEFALRSSTSGDAVSVWLEHDAKDDLCLAIVSDVVVVDLPRDLAGAERVTLRAPASSTAGGETTIQLR